MWVGEEEQEDGAGFPGSRTFFGAQSGVSTGVGGLGFVSTRKHREKEPLKGQHLLALGPDGRSSLRESLGELLRAGEGGETGLCFFISFSFCFVFVGSSLFSNFGSFLYKGK